METYTAINLNNMLLTGYNSLQYTVTVYRLE